MTPNPVSNARTMYSIRCGRSTAHKVFGLRAIADDCFCVGNANVIAIVHVWIFQHPKVTLMQRERIGETHIYID